MNDLRFALRSLRNAPGFSVVDGVLLRPAPGLVGALAVSCMLASLLHGVGSRDPLTFAAAALGLGAVALLATDFPTVRAARMDPTAALRQE